MSTPKIPQAPYNFYGDVTVVVRRRLRVSATFENGPPEIEEMLEVLQNGDYDDIYDEEDLEIMTVESIDNDAEEDDSKEDDSEE